MRTLLLYTLCGWLALVSSAAAQRGPEKALAGRALTSDKPFPTYAKSTKAYIAAVKKHSKAAVMENEKDKTWEVFVAAFLKASSKNLEVTVKIIDITDGQLAVVSSFEQYLDAIDQRAILTSFVLERDKVGVNRQLVLQIEDRGRVLASGKVKILGKWEKHSGQVDFTAGE